MRELIHYLDVKFLYLVFLDVTTYLAYLIFLTTGYQIILLVLYADNWSNNIKYVVY